MAETVDIVDRAEGNAFFVEELTSAAAGPGRWVPADLADVLLVRLDRLDDDARAGRTRAASVAGRQVSHELLAAASGLAGAALDEGLRQAVEMNVLVPDGDRYAFRHALLGEAVYDDLLPGERVRLHDRLRRRARDGPDVTGTAAELARHARLAHDLETALLASHPRRPRRARGRRPRRGRPPLRAGAGAADRPAAARGGRRRPRPPWSSTSPTR